jgi:CSLREA domain-containing protein
VNARTSPRLVALTMAVAVIAAWIASTALPSVALEDDETFQVNTTVDGFDGVCNDAHCSLRDAIAAAAPRDTVLVSPGFYALTVTGNGGVGEGDIDLRSAITIEGGGETGVFIDASALGQRAFTLGVADAGKRYLLEGLTIFGARDPAIDGAAVKVVSGTGVLSGVTVSGSLGDDGGAVWSGPGTSTTATDSLFIGNSAAGTGGAIHSEGALSVDGITVTGNTAIDGAGLFATGPTAEMQNSTIAGNTATGGGGGLYLDGAAELSSMTIAENEAARGGGVRRPSTGTGDATIRSSIVSDNTAPEGRDCSGDLDSLGGNMGNAKGCGLREPTDRSGRDPQLRRLGPNGGPTPTMALRPTSPAIGSGIECSRRDQRGAPRDRRCDAGAYELVRCLGKPVNIVGTPGNDELSGGRGPDVFLGMGGDDEFQGSIGKDRACGGPGNDLLIAGPGDDRFDGEVGNDRVRGESGGDWVWGGAGRDRLVGGPGDDRCHAERRDRDPRGCEILVTAVARRTAT